jgi:hypothetical protein
MDKPMMIIRLTQKLAKKIREPEGDVAEIYKFAEVSRIAW